MGRVVSQKVLECNAVWLHGASCTGCTVSALNAANPGIVDVILKQLLPGKHVNLRFHTTIMAPAGKPVMEVLHGIESSGGIDVLIVEGAIPTRDASYCMLGEHSFGEEVASLSRVASVVISLGTCAAFGGIPAGQPNPTGCVGVRELLEQKGVDKPVINVPGCPAHPDWLLGTIGFLLVDPSAVLSNLDDYGRPLLYYGQLIHENCPRRAAFNEGKFAKYPGDTGCLYELGCKGPITYSDCPSRLWNNSKGWCIGVGFPCNGCTQPEFPDLVGPFFEKIADVDLPMIGEYWAKKEV